MLSFTELNEEETNKQNEFQIIYANDELIVVNKPYDVPMDGTGYKITVEEWAIKYMEVHNISVKGVNSNNNNNSECEDATTRKTGKKQLKFVHQLDYSTSGVLCLALSKDMAARLAHCFQMRTCQKYYLAILQGHVPVFEMFDGNNIDNTHKRIRWNEFMQEQIMGNDSKCSCLESISQSLEESTSRQEEGIWIVDSKSITRSIDRENVHSITSYCEKDYLKEQEQSKFSRGNSLNKEETLESHTTCSEEVYFNKLLNERHNVLEINLPIGYDITDTSGFRMAVQGAKSNIGHCDHHNHDTGKSSTTYLHVLERCYMRSARTGKLCPVTKVLLEPHTGRRHQLRVHCHALGYPILGDVTYTRSELAKVSTNGQFVKDCNHSSNNNSITCDIKNENEYEEESSKQEILNADTHTIDEANFVSSNVLHIKDIEFCSLQTNDFITTMNTNTNTNTNTTTTTITSTALPKAKDWSRMYLHAWRLCVPCNVNTQWTEQDKRAQRRKRRRETLKLESAAGNAAELSTWTEFIATNSLW